MHSNIWGYLDIKYLERCILTFTLLPPVSYAASKDDINELAPTSNVDQLTALQDAIKLAKLTPNTTVVTVKGNSMRPYFADGAILVVKTNGLQKLSAGDLVLYRSHKGEIIVHRLLVPTPKGWIIRGSNNLSDDPDVVSAANYLGTVYVTFYTDPTQPQLASLSQAELEYVTHVALAKSDH